MSLTTKPQPPPAPSPRNCSDLARPPGISTSGSHFPGDSPRPCPSLQLRNGAPTPHPHPCLRCWREQGFRRWVLQGKEEPRGVQLAAFGGWKRESGGYGLGERRGRKGPEKGRRKKAGGPQPGPQGTDVRVSAGRASTFSGPRLPLTQVTPSPALTLWPMPRRPLGLREPSHEPEAFLVSSNS